MSLSKLISVLHAVITGSIFLPWSNNVDFGYANMVVGVNLQFGFVRPAAWVMIVFCFLYYFVDLLLKKIAPLIIEKIRNYFVWALFFIAGFESFSITFLSAPGMYVPQIGLTTAFISSILIVILYNIKSYQKDI